MTSLAFRGQVITLERTSERWALRPTGGGALVRQGGRKLVVAVTVHRKSMCPYRNLRFAAPKRNLPPF